MVIVVGISFVWAFILAAGILTMPESPRYAIFRIASITFFPARNFIDDANEILRR